MLFVRGTSDYTFKAWKQIQGNFWKVSVGVILTGGKLLVGEKFNRVKLLVGVKFSH